MANTGYVIGIDPGLKGGIAMMAISGRQCDASPMPVKKRCSAGKQENVIFLNEIELFIGESPGIVMIEKPGLRPGEGIKSTRTSFISYGQILGMLQTKFPCGKVFEVDPKTWQKAVYGKTTSDKKVGVDWCKRRYPKLGLLATDRSRVPHTGMTDAVCIAEYARRFYLGKHNETV